MRHALWIAFSLMLCLNLSAASAGEKLALPRVADALVAAEPLQGFELSQFETESPWTESGGMWAAGYPPGEDFSEDALKDGLLQGVFGCYENIFFPGKAICLLSAGNEVLALESSLSFFVERVRDWDAVTASFMGARTICKPMERSFDPETMLRTVRQQCLTHGAQQVFTLQIAIKGGWET